MFQNWLWKLQSLGPRVVSCPLLGPIGRPPRHWAGDARRGERQSRNVCHAPVYLRRRRVLQSDQVHLDPEVLEQELAWDATHRVEGVIRVRMGCPWWREKFKIPRWFFNAGPAKRKYLKSSPSISSTWNCKRCYYGSAYYQSFIRINLVHNRAQQGQLGYKPHFDLFEPATNGNRFGPASNTMGRAMTHVSKCKILVESARMLNLKKCELQWNL